MEAILRHRGDDICGLERESANKPQPHQGVDVVAVFASYALSKRVRRYLNDILATEM
jgi:hypothetical protein